MSNAVVKKIVYSVEVELVSPLCISQGDGSLTDDDVIVNGEGLPFIPGSSLAGAMRSYLDAGKEEECIFGYEDMHKNVGRMSSLFVSDLFFQDQVQTKIRDGVKLGKNKAAESQGKYDMEVVDTGAKGHFFMEVVIRKNDNQADFEAQLDKVFTGWLTKEIRLGRKKSRGYGEVRLVAVEKKEFDASNILEYKDAYVAAESHDASWTKLDLASMKTTDSKYVTLSLPLRLEGAISIRKYAAKKNEPDFVHITANGKPVIPGTSFTGAIRHRLSDILEQLEAMNQQELVDAIFGFVDTKAKVEEETLKAHISDIIVSECVLEDSKPLIMVRNAISRFEAGTKKGALFKERAYVGGTTVLEIKVKKTETTNETVGLLLLAMKDLQNGFLPVGGQTSIGRGVFAGNGELTIQSDVSEEEYMKAAWAALRRK